MHKLNELIKQSYNPGHNCFVITFEINRETGEWELKSEPTEDYNCDGFIDTFHDHISFSVYADDEKEYLISVREMLFNRILKLQDDNVQAENRLDKNRDLVDKLESFYDGYV